jgi:hypothetical protein
MLICIGAVSIDDMDSERLSLQWLRTRSVLCDRSRGRSRDAIDILISSSVRPHGYATVTMSMQVDGEIRLGEEEMYLRMSANVKPSCL